MTKGKIPAYRIIALANLDLEQHMEDHPLVLEGKQRVRWDVEETDYHYIAKGVIRVPVEIYFGKDGDSDEDPEIRRVIIAGKRKYDARLEEIDEEAEEAPDYGIDEDAVRAENYNNFRRNISG